MYCNMCIIKLFETFKAYLRHLMKRTDSFLSEQFSSHSMLFHQHFIVVVGFFSKISQNTNKHINNSSVQIPVFANWIQQKSFCVKHNAVAWRELDLKKGKYFQVLFFRALTITEG